MTHRPQGHDSEDGHLEYIIGHEDPSGEGHRSLSDELHDLVTFRSEQASLSATGGRDAARGENARRSTRHLRDSCRGSHGIGTPIRGHPAGSWTCSSRRPRAQDACLSTAFGEPVDRSAADPDRLRIVITDTGVDMPSRTVHTPIERLRHPPVTWESDRCPRSKHRNRRAGPSTGHRSEPDM